MWETQNGKAYVNCLVISRNADDLAFVVSGIALYGESATAYVGNTPSVGLIF